MDNFYVTADRIFRDVKVLNDSNLSSWFNTCYLSGYILECYGKLLIVAEGTSNPRRFSHNIVNINDEIQNTIVSNTTLAKYCMDLKLTCSTIYEEPHKWDPKNRYEDNPDLWNSEIIANSFIRESSIVMAKINEMKLDGVI